MQLLQYAAALVEVHALDYVLTAAFAAFGTLVTIVGYLIRKRMEVYDKHLEECRERAITAGRMEERLIAINERTDWLGEYVEKIGDKLGVVAPAMKSARPYGGFK